jgi:hypothetical protein
MEQPAHLIPPHACTIKRSDGGVKRAKEVFSMYGHTRQQKKRPGTDYVAEPFLFASKIELTSS